MAADATLGRPSFSLVARSRPVNYRHAFHAGNFADVFNHAVLARVLVYLMRKPAPLRFVDTHGGIGRYDLASAEAGRTGEWRGGIGRLDTATVPPAARDLLAPYLEAVGARDADGRPSFYPGSPALAQWLLRADDRIVICELHPADAEALKTNMGRDRRVKILTLDGYAGLKALTPPPERRGIVLIDPPFEAADEFERMTAGLVEAHRRWPTGIYLLWYPLKDRAAVARFTDALARSGVPRILQLHLSVADVPAAGTGQGLSGCGLAVVNPPYGLKDEAEILLPALAQALGRERPGSWSARTLVGEAGALEPARSMGITRPR